MSALIVIARASRARHDDGDERAPRHRSFFVVLVARARRAYGRDRASPSLAAEGVFDTTFILAGLPTLRA